jgi:hypothetical protein
MTPMNGSRRIKDRALDRSNCNCNGKGKGRGRGRGKGKGLTPVTLMERIRADIEG